MQLRYYFPYSGEDIDRMHSAAQHFVGEHDFRNFCGPVCFDDVKRRWMTGEMLAASTSKPQPQPDFFFASKVAVGHPNSLSIQVLVGWM